MNTRQTALITGASEGIGLELTRIFAREGYSVALVARNEARLQEVAGMMKGRALIVPADLSDPAAPRRIFDELQRQDFQPQVLVNNAGFGTYGLFSETSADDEMREIQVNVAALTHLTKLFLPGMLKNRAGRIMNVASVAAFPPGPLMAVYYATKAYVLSLSEALSVELRGTGVTVTCLCPGPTPTQFGKRAGIAESPLFKGKMPSAATVAEIGYRGMMEGKRVVIPGFSNKIMAAGARLAPRSVSAHVVHHLQRQRRK